MANAIGAEAVQAVLDGFLSPKAEEILASLRTLAGLLKTAGEEEDRREVVSLLSLLERASARAASRQDSAAGAIAMVVNVLLMSKRSVWWCDYSSCVVIMTRSVKVATASTAGSSIAGPSNRQIISKLGCKSPEVVAFLTGHGGREDFLKAAVEKLRRHAERLSGVKSDIAGTATPQRDAAARKEKRRCCWKPEWIGLRSEPVGSGASGMKHIVLNCANIGCTYGENVLKRTKPGQNKFDWKGVEDAYQYYEGAGFTVHAIIGQRLLSQVGGRDKISRKLESALVVIPSRDGLPDIDDYSTILEAYKWKCSYVDNDNYREWGARMKGRPEVARWYGENKRQLHIPYYFDRFGHFTPLDGAAPGTAEPSRKDPTPNLPAATALHPAQERQALSSSPSGSSQTVTAGNAAPASLGPGGQRAQEARSQGEKRGVQEAPAGSEPAAKRSRGELEVIQLGKEIIAPPTSKLKWKAVVPVQVWQRPQVGGYQECLRTLKPGAIFLQIAQQPREGVQGSDDQMLCLFLLYLEAFHWPERPMLQMAQQILNGLLDGSFAKIFSFLPRGELSPAALKVGIAEGIKTGRRMPRKHITSLCQWRNQHAEESHDQVALQLAFQDCTGGLQLRCLHEQALAVMDPEDLELHSDVVAGRLQDTDDDVCFEAHKCSETRFMSGVRV
ncbi:unnamed protein product [Symbiodinium sp. CCMP2456]|nr:unnamed protein product [Symbiodinium sp. CCMP2456]